MDEEHTPETMISFLPSNRTYLIMSLYISLFIWCIQVIVNLFIKLIYLLIYVSHVPDVLNFLFLYTFILYLDSQCFVYVFYVLFILWFHVLITIHFGLFVWFVWRLKTSYL